ncbi:MAG: DUF5074 domain-containing protein, partial [Bacteroidales bacterium]
MNKQKFTLITGVLLFLFGFKLFATNPPLINDYQDRNTIYFTEDNTNFDFKVKDEITKVKVNEVVVTLENKTFTALIVPGENKIETYKTMVINGFPMENKVSDFTVKGKKISYQLSNGGNVKPGEEFTITFNSLDAPMVPIPSVVNPKSTQVSYKTDIPNLTEVLAPSAGSYGSIDQETLNTLKFTVPAATPEGQYNLSSGSVFVKWYGNPIYDGQEMDGWSYGYYFSTLPDISVNVSSEAISDTEAPVIQCSVIDNSTLEDKVYTFTASATDNIDGNVDAVVKCNNTLVQVSSNTANTYTVTLNNGANTINVHAEDGSGNVADNNYTVSYNMQAAVNKVIQGIDNLPVVSELQYSHRAQFYQVYNQYLSLTEEEKNLVTNSDKLLSLKEKMDQLDEDQFPKYTSFFPMFRKDNQNSGVVNIKLPIKEDQAYEKWAVKYGSGMFGAVGTPLVVNNELYIVKSNQIKRINKETGAELATATMEGSMGFHSFPAYGEGKIFVPIGTGRIQAFNAETLESLWVSASYPYEQTNSPVIYNNGFVYSGSGKAGVSNSDSGHYFCLSTKDEDPTKSTEIKEAKWIYQIPEADSRKAFYWSGGCVVGNYIYFGGDNGKLVAHHLTNDEVLDVYEGTGDIRSSVTYDNSSKKIYFSTKGGWLYSIPLNDNGSFDKVNGKKLYVGTTTCSPVVYNNRIYIGTGVMASSELGIKVIDATKMEVIYTAATSTMFQSSALLSTAYANGDNKQTVYVYFLPNGNDSKIMMLKDYEGNTTADIKEIFTPSKKQMCTQSLVCDAEGNFYYSNDSGHLFGVGMLNTDEPPVVVKPLADLKVEKNASTQDIDLSEVFNDPDNDNNAFTFSASSSSDVVVPSIDEKNLKLTFATEKYGIAEVTIKAVSNGKEVENKFTVSVIPTFDDITYWVGEGDNRAALQVQWGDNKKVDTLVWGYRWNGKATGEDMLKAIAASDPRFFGMLSSGTAYGSAIGGLGYDCNLENLVQIHKQDSEENIAPNAEGLIESKNYDFENWVCDDSGDHFSAGWNDYFWGYFKRDDNSTDWKLSDLGISSLELSNGNWNALYYVPFNGADNRKERGNSRFTDKFPSYIFNPASNGSQPPVVANPLGKIIIPQGETVTKDISLENTFTDPDNNDLYIKWSVTDVSVPEKVKASIVDNNLHIEFLSDDLKKCLITVQAKSNKKSVEDVLTLKSDVGDYTDGVFIVNEDWFGTDNGSVNFLYNDGSIDYRIYRKENNEEKLGVTTEYGSIYGDKFFLVSKQAPRFVVTDAITLKKIASFDEIDGKDGRAFVGVTPDLGYISTSDGIYMFDIKNMKLKERIAETNGQTGSMLKVGDYVFAVQPGKILVLKDNKVSSTITGESYGGITQSKDGSVWVGAGSKLIQINPFTLEVSKIDLPANAKTASVWGAWNANSLCASITENSIYWAKSAGMFGGSKDVYKYKIDDKSGLETPFITVDAPYSFYGAGMRIDPATDKMYLTVNKGYSGFNQNKVLIYNAISGEEIINYQLEDYYWFPALVVFPDTFVPEITLSDLNIEYG